MPKVKFSRNNNKIFFFYLESLNISDNSKKKKSLFLKWELIL